MNTKITARVSAFFAIIAASAGLACAAAKPEIEAQKAAEQWLALVDAGKFADSWDTAAAYFKAAVTKEQWETSLVAVRKPLGDLVSRKLKSAKYSKTLPGAPDGEYVVLQFDTAFSNKKSAVETITPLLDKDGKWRVSGYFIK
ncbi:MAG: DUF4019 domain-containing protein [Verrucomicrobia bacterium]|nr:DUF4019 domain-containing protein [Verrucomicrobiota bacterium]